MNTGGPAFPGKQKALMIKSEHIGIANEYEIEHNGMTLRDYFAAKAMQAVIANAMCSEKEAVFYDEVSAISYEMADAMLKARGNNEH